MKNGNMKKKPLNILQWNADSIRTKKDEFRETLEKHKVDIFLVQETKLTQGDKVPIFPGYTILSNPRTQTAGNDENRGGGLMTGIGTKIPYKEVKDLNLNGREDDMTETQTVEIPLSENEKLRITNIYIPKSGSDTVVTTQRWPSQNCDIIAGDVNAHALSWDSSMELEANHGGPEFIRGEMIEGWMADKDMICMNDGTTTYTDRRTGKESTPNVTLLHASQAEKFDWKVLDELGGSDHKPILLTRHAEEIAEVNNNKTWKCNLREADYGKLSEEIEKDLPEGYKNKNIVKRSSNQE